METDNETNVGPRIITILIIAIGINVYWISPTISTWVLGTVVFLYFLSYAKEGIYKKLDEVTTREFREYIKEQTVILQDGRINLTVLELLVYNCTNMSKSLQHRNYKEQAEIIEKSTAVLQSILNEEKRALECTQKKSSGASERS